MWLCRVIPAMPLRRDRVHHSGVPNYYRPGQQGFVDYRDFSSTIQPNILVHNAKRLEHLSSMQPSIEFHEKHLDKLREYKSRLGMSSNLMGRSGATLLRGRDSGLLRLIPCATSILLRLHLPIIQRTLTKP